MKTDIVNKKKRKRELLAENREFTNIKIAFLCGSSPGDIPDYLEIFLLERGLRPSFFIGGYNRYYEETLYSDELLHFSPDIIYYHTTSFNIAKMPEINVGEKSVELLESEAGRLKKLWDICLSRHSSVIIQNNFEPPLERALGNLEFSEAGGSVGFINSLNECVKEYARSHSGFHVQDIAWLSAREGLSAWHSPKYMYLYKYAVSHKCMPVLAANLASMIAAVYGKRKKCIVLDLDNTLWGGIVGEDGVSGIKAGMDSAVGESYLAFQKYLKRLSDSGVMLAVASKNDEAIAKSGFKADGMLLDVEDFVSFYANWEPKTDSIKKIALELNLGLDSIVFIDDNPAERELVIKFLPEVSVIDANEPLEFIQLLDSSGFFEAVSINEDDVKRIEMYNENRLRTETAAEYDDYKEYLLDLSMSCSFSPINERNVQRASALINKTNQFNITALRMTEAEALKISKDSEWITICGRLSDRFGDNGLITVFIGQIKDGFLNVHLWVMSCRVFSRNLEYALFDEVIRLCLEKGITRVRGCYTPTGKNRPVEKLYDLLGFKLLSQSKSKAEWEYEIPENYKNKTDVIEIYREE